MRLLVLAVLLPACSEYQVLTDTREEAIFEDFLVEGARTDVLFFGDTSYSMQRDLITMGDTLDTFVERIDDNQSDWQIIAVTGPTGCAQGGILTPDTDDVEDAFAAGLMTPPGDDDVDEWGLFNVFQAVMESAPGGCNEGFLRDDATLHVVFLSDEDDNSPGWELGGDYWETYVDPVLYAKGDPNKVRFSAIVGPTPNGCDTADPGWGYVDAVEATDGELLSICSDWADDIEILADASLTQDLFHLAHEPLPDTLEVQVNGEDRTDGWTYDDEAVAVRFTEDLPRAWDEVTASYTAIIEFEVEE